MSKDETAVPRLVAIDRRQLILRTMDVEKLVEPEHCVRSIWELVGRLDLRLYYAQIAAVEGSAGREHTDPQLLISLWLYAYSRGSSSARELARQCEYEPGCQWLCGLQPVSHRTLSGFRSENKSALDDLFTQVLGMLSAEGLITLERVTLDGTKIKANAGGNTFRGREKIVVHLAAAREQVRVLNQQAENEEQLAKRQGAAKRRAARQRASRLEAALREVERLQREKVHDRKTFVARASSTDSEAHVMRNGEGGTVPSYNVQLVTDTQHGLVVNVEATTDAIDYRQLDPALEQCEPPGARPAWRRSVTRIEEPSATTAFKAKMKTEEGRQIYARRSQIAEFAHAWIKERCGLRQFRCRGRLKTTMEATWACLTYNLMRWFGLQRALQAATAT